MAYNEEKLTKLKSLKQLAERIGADFATKTELADLSGRVDELVAAGGEPNVITAVKNNGAALEITDKAVDIGAAIAAAVAGADHLQRKKVDSRDAIDPAAEGADKFIYMVPKAGGKNGDKYDEYMVLDGAVEPVGDWAVDLSEYAKTADVVAREAGKGLSANDYTDEDKAKLAGLEIAGDAEVAEMLTEVFGAAE